MSIYYPGCPEVIIDPQCTDCSEAENGDVRSFFLVKSDFAFSDITDPAEWAAGITSGDIYVFPYAKGSLEIEENVSEGFGDNLETTDSYTYTMSVMEPNYQGDWAFWNSIKNSRNFRAGYRTESYVHLFDKTTSIVAKAPVGEGKTNKVNWNLVFKTIQEEIPRPYATPDGVFTQCVAVS